MKLTCKSCRHDFSVDELNLDTDSVECPKCRWPNLLSKQRLNKGHFGQFSKVKKFARPILKTWPRSDL